MVKGTFEEVLQQDESMKEETVERVIDKLKSLGYTTDQYNKFQSNNYHFTLPQSNKRLALLCYMPYANKFVVKLNSGFVATQHVQNIKDDLDTVNVHATQLNAIIEEEV